ncbi:PIN domain-containing protein [Trichlorobacter lovleyi]|uniref:type II toxin-antitoxin system VapC family toxin n=1 Tax=Trichlorobacter lovleyi TaxID=313985 RepID=UPI00223FDC04|nr:PIN domain-containing protein [Trichlorobacter lovleyi]QOX78345.1 PIN domain-containing protein [Trichlorobacter lovleyi]
MKILLDTNIVLDLLMDRMPFADAAAELFSKVEDGSATGYLCGTTITTVYYLAAKVVGTPKAQEELKKLLSLFEVAPVNRPVLQSALAAGFGDFEDAVIHESAGHVGAEAIVTRNQKDFKKSKIPVYSAEEVVKVLSLKAVSSEP